ETFALRADSPARDAGDPNRLPADLTTDQRGFLRVVNGKMDIGAFQSGLTVTTLGTDFANGIQLLEALDVARLLSQIIPNQTITFAPGLNGTVTGSFYLWDLRNHGTLRIDGDNRITVSGGRTQRPFFNETESVSILSNLTIADGYAENSVGGGIYNNGG